MNKDLKATLITISMILGFTGFITLLIAFPQIVLWLLVSIAFFCGINIAILLWDTVRMGLDKDDLDLDDKPTDSAPLTSVTPKNAKEMMITKKDDFFNIEFDEDDKNQIG